MNKAVTFSPLNLCTPLNTFALVHLNRKYYMNPALLAVCSPVIANKLQSDPSLRELELPPVKGPMQDLVSILFGQKCRISAANCRFLNYMGKFLEIEPLVDATAGILQGYNSLSDVIKFAESLLAAGLNVESEADQVAENINLVKDFTMLSPELLTLVISSSRLKCPFEAFISKTLVPFIEQNPKWSPVIAGIDFRKLTDSARKKILCLPCVDLNLIRGFVTDALSYSPEDV